MPLVGIDPDARKTVEYGGATFTLRGIPKGLFTRLRQRNLVAIESAKRRVIKRLSEEGVDPESTQITLKDGRVLTHLEVGTMWEPQYQEDLHRYELELMRWSLVGQSGFQRSDDSPVPWVTERAAYEGEELEVPAKETLRWYAANADLLHHLFMHAEGMNMLDASEKKA
jgi:hypothetical protein